MPSHLHTTNADAPRTRTDKRRRLFFMQLRRSLHQEADHVQTSDRRAPTKRVSYLLEKTFHIVVLFIAQVVHFVPVHHARTPTDQRRPSLNCSVHAAQTEQSSRPGTRHAAPSHVPVVVHRIQPSSHFLSCSARDRIGKHCQPVAPSCGNYVARIYVDVEFGIA